MSLDAPSNNGHPPLAINDRVVAMLEVLLCSDFPTQIAIAGTLALFGLAPLPGGRLSVAYVVVLSVADTVVLLSLVFFFLHIHGENYRDVLLGRRPVAREVSAGVPLIPVAIGIGLVVLLSIQKYAPILHTVEKNPLQDLLRTPRDAWLFAFVVIVAGGLREEIQRAFLLHRFKVWLGGGLTGLIVTSASFGLGHVIQGGDAAIATGLLGAFWGAVYLRRRSCVAPIVSHTGFDLLQILQFVMVGR